MLKKITAVYPMEDFVRLVWFEGGEAKTCDVAPLLNEWDAARVFVGAKL